MKNLFNLRRNNNFIYLIIIAALSLLGVGYAAFTADLKINGLFTFNISELNMYFENIKLDEESVTDDIPTIDDDGYTIEFKTSLKSPGDYYQFNVDLVNNGTKDSQVAEIKITGIEEDDEKYINTFIEKIDGTQLSVDDVFESNTSSPLVIGVEYADIELEDIPEEAIELNIQIEVEFKQAS